MSERGSEPASKTSREQLLLFCDRSMVCYGPFAQNIASDGSSQLQSLLPVGSQPIYGVVSRQCCSIAACGQPGLAADVACSSNSTPLAALLPQQNFCAEMSADFSRIMSGPLPAGQAQLTAATTAAAGCMQVCDETSPLSSDSSTVLGLQHTPMGVEVISIGCKRNYDQLASSQAGLSHQAQHQVAQQTLLFLQQRQALLQQHKSCNQLLGHVPARPHLQPAPQQQVASQVLHTVNSKVEAAKQQLQALLMQHSQHQQHRSSLEAVKAAVGSKRVVVGGAQQQLSVPFCHQQLGGGPLAWQQQQQQLAALKLQQQQPSPAQQQLELLAEQGSGFSVTSSAASFSSTTTGISTIQQHRSAPPASCNSDAVRAWQTLVMQQQRVRLQEQQQQHSLQQWQPQLAQAAAVTHVSSLTRPLLSSAGSVTSSGSCALTTTLSLIQHQQQLQQRLQQQQLQHQAPPAKRPATQSAVAALLSVSAATAQAKHMQLQLKLHQLQQQQQRPAALLRQASQPQSLLKPGLITSAGSADSSMLSSAALAAAVAAAAAAVAARVCRSAPDAVQNRLLSWAGQVLCCHLQDAYLLATHLYSKVCGRLDDMLLISLGITQPLDNVTMLVCLWVATKLEGHRRQVAGCSKLGAALQLPPWSVTSVELHLMQLLGWQPYSGWLRPSDPPSCQVLEV